MPARRGGWWPSSNRRQGLSAAAPERRRLAAAGAPFVEAAVEYGARVEPRRLEHAGGDRRTRAALADRHERARTAEAVLGGLPRGPVRQMRAPGDEAGVALLRLSDVQQLDVSRSEPSLELLDRHGHESLVAAADTPAGELEDADRPEPARRLFSLGLVPGLDHDRPLGKDEGSLRAERRAGHWDVERTGPVAERKRVRLAHVEHDRVVGSDVELAQRRLRVEKRAAIQLDDRLHVGWARRQRAVGHRHELLIGLGERVVVAAFEADRRRG